MAAPEDNRNLISNLMGRSLMAMRLAGASRDAVLDELIACIPEIAGRAEDRARLLRALQEREELHSTGIGDGVALPHTRNALSGLVAQPVIVFGRHPQGVGYGAIDNKPVRLFFLIVTTSVTQHLQVLARISRLLRDARLRQQLMVSATPDEILAAIRQVELSQ